MFLAALQVVILPGHTSNPLVMFFIALNFVAAEGNTIALTRFGNKRRFQAGGQI